MSSVERVYTIPLGKALISQSQHRATRAINMIKEFARKHMKNANVRIDGELDQAIWARGARSPPRKIRVVMSVVDDNYVLVSKYNESTDIGIAEAKETEPQAAEQETPAVGDLASVQAGANDPGSDYKPLGEKLAGASEADAGTADEPQEQTAGDKAAAPDGNTAKEEVAPENDSPDKEPEEKKAQDGTDTKKDASK